MIDCKFGNQACSSLHEFKVPSIDSFSHLRFKAFNVTMINTLTPARSPCSTDRFSITVCSVGLCGVLALILLVLLGPAFADTSFDSSLHIDVPHIEVSKKDSSLCAPSDLSLTEWQQKVLESLENGRSTEAKKLVRSEIEKTKGANPELLYLLAYINSQTHNYKEAIKQLQKVLRQENSSPDRYRAFQIKCIGDCYYHMHHNKDALKQYKRALLMSNGLSELDPLRVQILEPLTGCLIEEGSLAEALSYEEQLHSLCERLARDKQLVNFGPLFWSEIELLQIYEQRGEQDKYEQLHKSFLVLLDRLLSLRNQLYAPLSLSEKVVFPSYLKQVLLAQYIALNNPTTLPEYLWLSSSYRLRTLPLISWEPQGQKANAVILCLHGLLLENRVFDPFACEMTARNFLVYAMDVRSFGSWQSEFTKETTSFNRSLSDIHAAIRVIKERHPNLPIFLLGESMGGALALRAASEFGNDMTGVICSACSGEFYDEANLSIRTAAHLLLHPSRPFDIGAKVAAQATSNPKLITLWKMDPMSKEKQSPIELIKLKDFMLTTQHRCNLIKSTPVLVVQGLADRLVNPKGTYNLFDNISSPDKAMIILGNGEHLIFETPDQSPVLLDGLTAWLNNHIQRAKQ